MSREIKHTGGSKEFHYTSEDIQRIESEDTDSTREFKESLRKWRGSIKYKMLKFFRNISPRSYYNYKPLLKNFSILIILGIVMAIIYSNLEKLNSIVLIFIKLGSALMLVGLFFFLKYIYRTYKNIKYLLQIQRSLIKWSLAIILLILLLFAYQNRGNVFDPIVRTYEKTDFGIFYPFTFSFKDVYESASSQLDVEDLDESEANPIQKIITTPPERKDDAKDAFNYLNQFRQDNNREKLIWDDRVYDLAVFRSKDMYERDYFDHVTPEGKCAEDFKSQFGITEYGTFAENIGGMTHYGDGTPVGDTSVKEAVDGWMTSRGHKYALMYPYSDYKKGAIGCYYSICTFLVLTTEPFQCVHGDEGLAYWETVGKQPGEI